MLLFAAALMMTAEVNTPVYTLEPVGIDFYYLPEYLMPLEEGVLDDESGALSGQPNSHGVSFACHYWKMETPVEDKDLWIEQKLLSVMSPDLLERIVTAEPTWAEGSLSADVHSTRSLGLMSRIGFTISPDGGSLGRGMAYGIFRNGYAVLLVAYGPSDYNPYQELQRVTAEAVLSE